MSEPDPQDPRTDTETPEELFFMPDTFEAQWPGDCVNCSTRIKKGDEIVGVGNGDYAHAECPEERILNLVAQHGVCGACFLALPATGVCGSC